MTAYATLVNTDTLESTSEIEIFWNEDDREMATWTASALRQEQEQKHVENDEATQY